MGEWRLIPTVDPLERSDADLEPHVPSLDEILAELDKVEATAEAKAESEAQASEPRSPHSGATEDSLDR
jgi:hypothetical protein